MVFRDRHENTNYHRRGGVGNRFIEDLQKIQLDYSKNGLLNALESLLPIFDALGNQWSESYKSDSEPILQDIQKVRKLQNKDHSISKRKGTE